MDLSGQSGNLRSSESYFAGGRDEKRPVSWKNPLGRKADQQSKIIGAMAVHGVAGESVGKGKLESCLCAPSAEFPTIP